MIPNSKLVVNPGAEPDEWHEELYLRPGQSISWVGVTVLGTMVALSGVVLVLHLNEKVRLPRSLGSRPLRMISCVAHSFLFFRALWAQREDELERRRTSHHINFDAL